MESSSRELLSKLKNNDDNALKIIFSTHYAPVFQVIRRIITDSSTCEDLAQEVFVKFWEKRHQIEIQGEIAPYLHRMAVNEALGYLRKKKKFITEDIEDQYDLASEGADASELYAHKELQTAVDNAMDKLPPKCRTVFMLSRFEGLSYKEIGTEMNISVKTVENQMGKALRLMRVYLSKYLTSLLFLIFSIFG